MIQFRALGEVAAVVDGERVALGGGRQRRLLAMLLIHRNNNAKGLVRLSGREFPVTET